MYFYFSRIANLILFNQLLLITVGVLITIVLYKLHSKTIAKLLTISIGIYFLIIAILPTGSFMMHSLEKQYDIPTELPKNIDGILVLSGGENVTKSKKYNQIYSGGSTFRIIESIRLQEQFPETKIVFSGGSGNHFSKNASSYVAEIFYNEFSKRPKNIIFESKSTNTYENFDFTNKLIDFEKNSKWIIVTSAFHMPRSIKVAKSFNLDPIAYPTEFRTSKNILFDFLNFDLLKNIHDFQLSMKEYFGFLTYKLLYKI